MNTDDYLSKPAVIGRIDAQGQFDVIWQSIKPIQGDAWSRYIPQTAGRTADFTFPWMCGGSE
jgi:urea transport system substrate-binding protein